MPYSSDSQRRWAHTETGEKALGGPKEVNEWDQASKGKKLPEKASEPKMADGGIVDAIQNYISNLYGKAEKAGPLGAPDSTLAGLAKVMADKSDASAADAIDPVVTNSTGAPTGFDDGGVVGPSDDGSVDVSQLPDAQAVPSPAPTFDPKAGMPAAPAAPAAVNPAISNYINAQKAQIGQYGPQQQQAVQQAILQRQNGLQGRLGAGFAGLADAINGAGGGHSNFAGNLQNKLQNQAVLQTEGLQNQRTANMQNVEANQKLDAQDPNSDISKATQRSQGLTLGALGFDPKTIGMMSASEIPSAIVTLKDLGLKDRELVVAKYKAQIEANQLAEQTRHNQAEEGTAKAGLVQAAEQHKAENALKGEEVGAGELEHAASVPLTSRIAGILGLNPAQAALQGQALGDNAPKIAGTQAPQVVHVTDAAQYQALPPGARYVDSTGQMKIKKGAQ